MIKAAVIGTGSISGVHLTYLKSRKDVQIVGLCDLNEVNLLKRHKEFGGECFADYRQMLAEVQPDAVWICTPSKVRREPLLACADRHIPIFCEKPAERDEKLARKIATELTRRKAKIRRIKAPGVTAIERADDRIRIDVEDLNGPVQVPDQDSLAIQGECRATEV